MTAHAQICNSQTPDEAPASRYKARSDGTATDLQTGLMWMRCALGQTWDAGSKSCRGQAALYTWQGALQAVQALNQGSGFAGHNDWRLPNLRELMSIERYHCVEPALNLKVFPTPAATVTWSATPLEGAVNLAWSLNFGPGHAEDRTMTSQHAVRLVRAGAFANKIPPPASSAGTNVLN